MASPGQLGLLSHLFDNLPLGLVVLDRHGHVVVYNRVEEQLAGRSRDQVMGARFFTEVAPCMNVRELGGAFDEQIGRGPIDIALDLSFPYAHLERPRDVRVRLRSFEVDEQPFGFLIIEDTSMVQAARRMREKLQELLVHDLKNPLGAVMLNLDLLADLPGVRDCPDAVEALADALDAGRRLSRMTVDLLDLARLESSTMPLRRTTSAIDAMLTRVVNDNRATARVYGARLGALPTGAIEAEVDEDLLIRALDNLVENALRHARHVTVSAAVIGADVVFRVADDGPGVPRELIDRLFDRYVQVQPAAAARGYNRGMGLTFVKLVAREHDGDVAVVCPTDGGTQFTMRIPLRPGTDAGARRPRTPSVGADIRTQGSSPPRA